MVEQYIERVHTENIVLDIGGEVGALIVYTRPELRGREIEVSRPDNDGRRTHTVVHERSFYGRTVYAAVFQELLGGEYILWSNKRKTETRVTVHGGEIVEVDWRDFREAYLPVFSRRDSGSSTRRIPESSPLSQLLPPRYQAGRAVCATPMGAAALLYGEDGKVAWDQMWTDFCDLALAGGPPHRGTLLEPVAPEEVRADPERYEHVLSEIERGWQLVTGLPVVRSERLGWLGLQCTDLEMALWMLRAIIVENVCVRREENILYLPAGPNFTLEQEIKNVVTVVAKTHHYWTEHALQPM